MAVNINFDDNSRQILNEAERKKGLILTAIGLKAVTIWNKVTMLYKAIDTGRYKGSQTSEANINEVVIGTNVEYAPDIELGTSRMKARPILRVTVLNYRKDYEVLAKQIWQQ